MTGIYDENGNNIWDEIKKAHKIVQARHPLSYFDDYCTLSEFRKDINAAKEISKENEESLKAFIKEAAQKAAEEAAKRPKDAIPDYGIFDFLNLDNKDDIDNEEPGWTGEEKWSPEESEDDRQMNDADINNDNIDTDNEIDEDDIDIDDEDDIDIGD